MKGKWFLTMVGAVVVAGWLLRPYGVELLPSIVALVLVFATRNVLGGLAGGALVGALLLNDGRWWRIPVELIEFHLLPNFASSWKTGAIVFTLLLGGMVQLLDRGGLLQAFFLKLLHGRQARRVEAGAAGFGLICFFDGLANSLMVGKIFQPMFDRAGISRLRLAYIADTTSSAVACLAFVSTWIAFQLSMIREGFVLAGREELAQPYRLFFLSWPHNYYALFSLSLLVVAIGRQWNIGAMRRAVAAEAAARPQGSLASAACSDKALATASQNGLWRAWLPMAVLLILVFAGIYADGLHRMDRTVLPLSWEKLALAFAEANVPAILILASLAGSAIAWIGFPRAALAVGEAVGQIYFKGVVQLLQPVLILVLAWMLSSTLKELGTAAFLGDLLSGRLPGQWLPLLVFLSSAVVAFTTGTSWGTMGLMMPLAIPMAFAMAGDEPAAMALIPVIVAAVFSGAVFGDHCSPISDTTIVSSIAAGVAPIDHVRTQLPYALLAATAAALLGFGPAGWLTGLPAQPWFTHAVFGGLLLWASRRARPCC